MTHPYNCECLTCFDGPRTAARCTKTAKCWGHATHRGPCRRSVAYLVDAVRELVAAVKREVEVRRG